MPPTSNQFRTADRLTDGRLAAILVELRGEGRTYEDIVRLLYSDYGIAVSTQTVYRWLASLDKPEAVA